MRLLSVRLIVSLIVGVTLVSLFSTYYEVRREKQGLRNDLERRAEVLGESLVGNVEPYLDGRSLKQLQRIVGRFSNREHLVGVAILNTRLEPIAQSSGLDQQLKIQCLAILEAIANNRKESRFVRRDGRSQNIYAFPCIGMMKLRANWSSFTTPAISMHRLPMYGAKLFASADTCCSDRAVTLVIVRWSIAGPIARAAQWMKGLRTGRVAVPWCHHAGSGSAPATGQRDGDFGGKLDGGPFSRGKRGTTT